MRPNQVNCLLALFFPKYPGALPNVSENASGQRCGRISLFSCAIPGVIAVKHSVQQSVGHRYEKPILVCNRHASGQTDKRNSGSRSQYRANQTLCSERSSSALVQHVNDAYDLFDHLALTFRRAYRTGWPAVFGDMDGQRRRNMRCWQSDTMHRQHCGKTHQTKMGNA